MYAHSKEKEEIVSIRAEVFKIESRQVAENSEPKCSSLQRPTQLTTPYLDLPKIRKNKFYQCQEQKDGL